MWCAFSRNPPALFDSCSPHTNGISLFLALQLHIDSNSQPADSPRNSFYQFIRNIDSMHCGLSAQQHQQHQHQQQCSVRLLLVVLSPSGARVGLGDLRISHGRNSMNCIPGDGDQTESVRHFLWGNFSGRKKKERNGLSLPITHSLPGSCRCRLSC